MSQKIKYDDLTYYFKTKSNPVSFSNLHCPLGLQEKYVIVVQT